MGKGGSQPISTDLMKDTTAVQPPPQPKRGLHDKYWKLAAETTSAAILAKDTLVPPKKPGLDRQPKTLNALGIGGILKQNQREKERVKSVKVVRSSTSVGDEVQKNRESGYVRRMTAVKRKSSAKSHNASLPGSYRRDSEGSFESGSRGTDDEDWELFSGDNDVYEGDSYMEKESAFEMAVVEIDVNEAQDEMDRTLKKMLNQARTTEREKTVLADTFGMFLQALVNMQEGEVEAIDHLQTKTGILQTITYFLKTAEDLKSTYTHSEDKMEEEEDRGILGNLRTPTVEDEPQEEESGEKKSESGGKTGKTIQGISVDEMNATTLRETYLTQRNKLDMQTHLKNIHAMELKQLQFEKTLMDLHYSKMVKPADLQREMRDLRKAVTDMQLELSVIQQESASVQSDILTQEKLLHEDEIITDRLDLEMLTKQMEVQQTSNKPLHLAKEADREAHKLEQVNDDLDLLNAKWNDGMAQIAKIQNDVDLRMVEFQSLMKDEGKMYHNRRNSLHDTESLNADMEMLLRKEQNLLDKCAACTESIHLAGKTRKRVMEELHHIHNNTNKAQREFNRLDHSVKMSQDALTNSKLAYDKMRSAFDSTKPTEDSNNWDKLSTMFQREIANLKNALTSKIEEANYSANQVERLQWKLNKMYDEQIDCGKELQILIRSTVRKRRERQEKSEQCIKLEAQVFKLVSDKKMQQLVMDDCRRTERELHKMTSALRTKYTFMKIERAGLMSDLIQTRQKLSEYVEKYKICTNEIDSYSNQLMDRTRELQRAHYLYLNARLARDSVRNEAFRAINVYRTYQNERNELQLCNDTLKKGIRAQQNEVVEIRRKFEESIRQSNSFALSLKEKTEELYTFMEKIKAYQLVILKGSMELRVRELEKNKMEAIENEVKKHLLIVTTNQPDERMIINQIESLRNRVFEITQERIDLEATVNNVHDTNRCREIHHELIDKRETAELLDVRLSALEHSLATRDCLSLERDLILTQVEEFTDDAVTKANYLKEHYANEVKLLVGLRKALYHTSNRIDGMICETSLATARADATEERYKFLKVKVEEAEARFKIGLSPTDAVEKEFGHLLWREEMIRRSNNQPKGFLFKPKPLTGSNIVIERMRPKPQQRGNRTSQVRARIPSPVHVVPVNCRRRPYRVIKKRPVTATRGRLLRTKTGLPMCNMTIF